MSLSDDGHDVPLIQKLHHNVTHDVEDDIESHYLQYQPVLECGKKNFFIWQLSSQRWGLLKIVLEVFGLLSFMISSSSVTDFGSFSIAWAHILMSYIVSPVWQNYTMRSTQHVTCEYGCLLGVGLVNMVSMLLGLHGCEPVDDSLSEHDNVTRFVPFSIYNRIYVVLHPGRELNPHLPEKGMENFGLGRSLLLVYSTSVRGSLNMAIFLHACFVIKNEGALFPQIFALIALILAIVDLRVYIVSLFFGIILYPYLIVVVFALYFPVCPDILNPPSGSLLFRVLSFYWKVVTVVDT